MFSSRQARARVARRARRAMGGELNLVPMIDIFTVLVTFLLMTAVFYRTVVLELNLPSGAASAEPPPPGLQLEVLVRKNQLEVADRNSGNLTTLVNTNQGYDLKGLSEFLLRIKQKYPDKLDASILLEPDVNYNALVQVMDTVRVSQFQQEGRWVQGELFPDISVGDAPQ